MVGKIRTSRKNKYTIDLILGLKCPDEGSATILGEEENGYEIVGAIRESYIDGVWNKEDESEWLTEIQVPIRKITGEEMSDKIFVP